MTDQPMLDGIPVWASKTLWMSLIVAVAPFFPPAQAVLIANPEITYVVVGGIFAVLRVISGKKVPMLGESGKAIKLK